MVLAVSEDDVFNNLETRKESAVFGFDLLLFVAPCITTGAVE